MNRARLEALLDRFSSLTVLVVGDYFLDQYLLIDGRLVEVSLETGLEAHQVVEVRSSPGAAGTVAANLRALGVGVVALGVIGADGPGLELVRALGRIGVDTRPLVEAPGRFTPVYLKPMLREPGGTFRELNRLDTKNRMSLPPELEQALLDRLAAALPGVQAVIVADQVSEPNCGAITERVRAELAVLAGQRPDLVFAADSRENIGRFENVLLKPNAREAVRAIHPDGDSADDQLVEACARALAARARRPVVVTLGPHGCLICFAGGCERVPTLPAAGPIDPVGAGDSAMAGLVAALGAGAALPEAALIGNLVASVTVQQIGTTGTAAPRQVLQQFDLLSDQLGRELP